MQLAIPFAATQATLDAITDALEEVNDAGTHEARARDIARRRAAFAQFERGAKPLSIPFRRPMWVSGTRTLTTQPLVPRAAPELTNDGRPVDELQTIALANAGGIVHFGGTVIRRRDVPPRSDGVILSTMSEALASHPALVEPVLARRCALATRRDALLTTAFMNAGVFLYVPDGVRVAAPLQLLWVASAGLTHALFPLVIVIVGRSSRVRVIERFLGGADAYINGMVDVSVAEDGVAEYVALQQLGDGAQMTMARSGAVARQARLAWSIADIGAAKIRNTTVQTLDGARASASFAALALRSGKQRIDHTLHVDHRAAATRAQTVFGVAVNDAAVARHTERLQVRSTARRVVSTARADGLMLSRKAAIEFKPQRDARQAEAAVGQRATIGSIDAESMFYIATRGIHKVAATKMIALGFFEPVISQFPEEILRDEVRTALDERIEEAVN